MPNYGLSLWNQVKAIKSQMHRSKNERDDKKKAKNLHLQNEPTNENFTAHERIQSTIKL